MKPFIIIEVKVVLQAIIKVNAVFKSIEINTFIFDTPPLLLL